MIFVMLTPKELERFVQPAPGHSGNHALLRRLQAKLDRDGLELDPRDVHDIRDATRVRYANYEHQFNALLSAVDRYY